MIDRHHVFGAPGTGKTTYLVDKAIQRLDEERLEPEQLGLFTFSRSGAEAFKAKLVQKTGHHPKKFPGVGTIHSQCMSLIKAKEDDAYSLVTAQNIHDFVKDSEFTAPTDPMIYRSHQDWVPQPIAEADFWKSLQVYYTRYYDRSVRQAIPYLQLPVSTMDTKFESFKDQWMEYKEKNRLVEFYDMPRIVLEEGLPAGYPLLFFDEHQDVTPLLHRVSKQWMTQAKEIWVCGDPNQAIYTYNGASPDLFMDFHGKSNVLDRSHRLAEPVWRAGLAVLRGVTDYFPSWAPLKSVKSNGKSAEVKRIPVTQLDAVFHMLERDRGTTLVIARTMGYLLQLARQLTTLGIAFRNLGTRVIGWQDDVTSLVNIYFKIQRKLPFTRQEVKAFVHLSKDDWYKSVYDLLKDQSIEMIPVEQLQKFVNSKLPLSRIWNFAVAGLPVDNRKSQFDLVTQEAVMNHIRSGKMIAPADKRKIALGTIHSAKGMEADNVLVFDGISQLMVNRLKENPQQREEEARVWYVATTRAKKKMFVISNNGLQYPLGAIAA